MEPLASLNKCLGLPTSTPVLAAPCASLARISVVRGVSVGGSGTRHGLRSQDRLASSDCVDRHRCQRGADRRPHASRSRLLSAGRGLRGGPRQRAGIHRRCADVGDRHGRLRCADRPHAAAARDLAPCAEAGGRHRGDRGSGLDRLPALRARHVLSAVPHRGWCGIRRGHADRLWPRLPLRPSGRFIRWESGGARSAWTMAAVLAAVVPFAIPRPVDTGWVEIQPADAAMFGDVTEQVTAQAPAAEAPRGRSARGRSARGRADAASGGRSAGSPDRRGAHACAGVRPLVPAGGGCAAGGPRCRSPRAASARRRPAAGRASPPAAASHGGGATVRAAGASTRHRRQACAGTSPRLRRRGLYRSRVRGSCST